MTVDPPALRTVLAAVASARNNANASGLSLRMVNVEPRELKVIWSYAGAEVSVR